jgi:hypothetical protein
MIKTLNTFNIPIYGPIILFYLTEFERKMKKHHKKCNENNHDCGKIIYKCNNSAWKQEFLFKHDKKWLKT